MIQRLKDCWLILTGKGSVRLYDDDRPPLFDRLRSALSEGLDPWCPCFEPDQNDQTIEEIADSIKGY